MTADQGAVYGEEIHGCDYAYRNGRAVRRVPHKLNDATYVLVEDGRSLSTFWEIRDHLRPRAPQAGAPQRDASKTSSAPIDVDFHLANGDAK